VCNNPRGEAEDWWLARTDVESPVGLSQQPVLKITPWSAALSHSADVKHLCGARCAQTLLDRWMRGEESR
jgi:hypothetical protein